MPSSSMHLINFLLNNHTPVKLVIITFPRSRKSKIESGNALFSNHNGPPSRYVHGFSMSLDETCYTSHHGLCMSSLCKVLSKMIRTPPRYCEAYRSQCRLTCLKISRAPPQRFCWTFTKSIELSHASPLKCAQRRP